MVAEGANMPTSPEGVDLFLQERLLYGPGKAANAGGVSVSGLEMSQNSMRLSWPREEVDSRLHMIMKSIHRTCVEAAESAQAPGNYVVGANVAGFKKVVEAMMDQGLVSIPVNESSLPSSSLGTPLREAPASRVSLLPYAVSSIAKLELGNQRISGWRADESAFIHGYFMVTLPLRQARK